MTARRWAVGAAGAALILAGCAGPPPASPQPEPPSAPPPATSDQPTQARGQNDALPAWAETTAEKTAGRFVVTAATPDTRIDERPEDAWGRAVDTWGTDELRRQLDEQKPLTAPHWWTDTMVPHDGWVQITLTNINSGEQPQAVGEEPQAATDVTVTYTRTHIRDGQAEPQPGTRTWTVSLTDDGRHVHAFKPATD